MLWLSCNYSSLVSLLAISLNQGFVVVRIFVFNSFSTYIHLNSSYYSANILDGLCFVLFFLTESPSHFAPTLLRAYSAASCQLMGGF